MNKTRIYQLLPSTLLLLLAACSSMTSMENTDMMVPNGPTNVYPIPSNGNDVIGRDFSVKAQSGDTLDTIGARYDIGANEMQQANPGLANKVLSSFNKVTIPAAFILPPPKDRRGIVINVAELRLFYFDKATNDVYTFPVALGREGWRTPITTTYVYRKQEAPSWNPPATVKQYMLEKHGKVVDDVVPPGPDNPLGDYAIYLQLPGYLIHGTNDARSIGRLVSSGCIRMYNHDVAQLFPRVDRGTPVTIEYSPNKVGWENKQLYLEAQTPIQDQEQFYQSHEVPADQLIQTATATKPANIDWTKVNQVLAQHQGEPTAIGYSEG